MRAVCLALFLATITFFTGCIPLGDSGQGRSSSAKEGSEESARSYFAGEMSKWMAGQESNASRLSRYAQSRPLKYEVLSVIPDKPFILLTKDGKPAPDDWYTYRLNVNVTFESQARTTLEKVIVYLITWNQEEKVWILKEQF